MTLQLCLVIKPNPGLVLVTKFNAISRYLDLRDWLASLQEDLRDLLVYLLELQVRAFFVSRLVVFVSYLPVSLDFSLLSLSDGQQIWRRPE